MQSFKNREELMRKMRSDLSNRIFPELVRIVGEAMVTKVRDGVHEAALASGDETVPKIQDPSYTKIPARASVMLLFTGEHDKAVAYEGAFGRFFEQNMRDKPKFLKFLRDNGVK